ncbi:hypothetical protein NEMIN01_2197 [Nematocida minor]|uniref:uncharacterized protein n=1 Tax=Nematocida minor TaxID=1912983 RepID=UPI002220AE27|nr:uncharacterized protein NEMIN01_2197 [Nematocida minor]KAI5192752.1 hypothetical protein NEMIN01_2197 [Nematocida minor]
MKEFLEKSETDAKAKRAVETLFDLFKVKVSRNPTANHAVLLWISNLYYASIHGVKDVYKKYDENINELYKYNKIKDTAQEILGKIAEIKHTTNKKIAEEYEAPE